MHFGSRFGFDEEESFADDDAMMALARNKIFVVIIVAFSLTSTGNSKWSISQSPVKKLLPRCAPLP